MRVVAAALLVVLIGLALLVGLKPLTPSRTFDDYEHKAKDTAESALSAVQTARLGARTGADGDAFGPTVSVVVADAEVGLSHAQSVFAGIQPPDTHSDRVRDRLGRLLTRASDEVAATRIAARRGDRAALARHIDPLRRIARRLDRFVLAHGGSR